MIHWRESFKSNFWKERQRSFCWSLATRQIDKAEVIFGVISNKVNWQGRGHFWVISNKVNWQGDRVDWHTYSFICQLFLYRFYFNHPAFRRWGTREEKDAHIDWFIPVVRWSATLNEQGLHFCKTISSSPYKTSFGKKLPYKSYKKA